MDSKKNNVAIIFMNSFNAVHALTALQMEIIFNSADLQQYLERSNERRNFISSSIQKETNFHFFRHFFVVTIAVLSLSLVVFTIKIH